MLDIYNQMKAEKMHSGVSLALVPRDGGAGSSASHGLARGQEQLSLPKNQNLISLRGGAADETKARTWWDSPQKVTMVPRHWSVFAGNKSRDGFVSGQTRSGWKHSCGCATARAGHRANTTLVSCSNTP